MIKDDGLDLPPGHIADIKTSYKYLGIPKLHGNHYKDARKRVTSEYYQSIRQVPKSQLNGKNMIKAIYT